MMNPHIARPKDLSEAAMMLRELGPGARVMAGATDLVVQRRKGLRETRHWVDLSQIQGKAREIRQEGDHIILGALVTFQSMAESELLRNTLPALTEAAQIMGSIAIRTRGTVGGNLGNASPAGDSIPPLLVGDAKVTLVSPDGRRTLPVEALHTGPGRLCLTSDELIEEVSIPMHPVRWSAFVRIGTRNAHEIAKVSAAVACTFQNHRALSVRVALGAVAPTVFRAREVEACLEGQVFSTALLAQASSLAIGAARPITDVRSTADYRAAQCGELVLTLFSRLEQKWAAA